MSHSFKIIALSAASLLLVQGCKTPATYVESNSPQTIVSLDKINTQDWAQAADQMIISLLSSNVLARDPNTPTIMAVSRIVNNTTQLVDTNLLTKKIRVALNQSGKVLTTSVIGPGGQAEDELARELAAEYNYPPAARPYFTLSGRIIEDRASAGSTKQVAYIFQMSLTEINTGLAVWEDEKTITKQGERNAVGW
ncbi:MAG: penicillin-binding protein activator LpoB [Verrucomicrobiota bacterium]